MIVLHKNKIYIYYLPMYDIKYVNIYKITNHWILFQATAAATYSRMDDHPAPGFVVLENLEI